MINCIIVDDEPHAIEVLDHYIKQTPHLHLIASFTNPIGALQLLAQQKIDLVFLDIQMPEISGIDFIKAIRGKSKVILTTAYSEVSRCCPSTINRSGTFCLTSTPIVFVPPE